MTKFTVYPTGLPFIPHRPGRYDTGTPPGRRQISFPSGSDEPRAIQYQKLAKKINFRYSSKNLRQFIKPGIILLYCQYICT